MNANIEKGTVAMILLVSTDIRLVISPVVNLCLNIQMTYWYRFNHRYCDTSKYLTLQYRTLQYLTLQYLNFLSFTKLYTRNLWIE